MDALATITVHGNESSALFRVELVEWFVAARASPIVDSETEFEANASIKLEWFGDDDNGDNAGNRALVEK